MRTELMPEETRREAEHQRRERMREMLERRALRSPADNAPRLDVSPLTRADVQQIVDHAVAAERARSDAAIAAHREEIGSVVLPAINAAIDKLIAKVREIEDDPAKRLREARALVDEVVGEVIERRLARDTLASRSPATH